jgi:hypothetical protein
VKIVPNLHWPQTLPKRKIIKSRGLQLQSTDSETANKSSCSERKINEQEENILDTIWPFHKALSKTAKKNAIGIGVTKLNLDHFVFQSVSQS